MNKYYKISIIKNYFAYLRNIKIFLTFIEYGLYCIVYSNNDQYNIYNDNKVYNRGKTMSMGYRPGNLDKIYHKCNRIQGWECESEDFWNELDSNFYFLNKYVNTDVFHYFSETSLTKIQKLVIILPFKFHQEVQ